VVIAHDPLADTPVAMTVGSFTSVSLDPPLVGFFPDQSSTTWPSIERAGQFVVNVLGDHQAKLCRAFSRRGIDRFHGVPWRPGRAGSPLIDGATAWIDCDLHSVTPAGDHHFVLGRVQDLSLGTRRSPLVFHGGRYTSIR
jgi:flavin reductase (DIM6/NTAB) family NADH-FMN oxidoreductase RutF